MCLSAVGLMASYWLFESYIHNLAIIKRKMLLLMGHADIRLVNAEGFLRQLLANGAGGSNLGKGRQWRVKSENKRREPLVQRSRRSGATTMSWPATSSPLSGRALQASA